MLDTWYRPRQAEASRMTFQDPAGEGVAAAARRVTEREAWSAPGVGILVAGVVIVLVGAGLLALGLTAGGGAGAIALIVVGILLLIVGDPTLRGQVSVQAGEARGPQLFGRLPVRIRSPR